MLLHIGPAFMTVKLSVLYMLDQYSHKPLNKMVSDLKKECPNAQLHISGDFNAHSPLWDNNRTRSDTQAERIEEFIDMNDLIVLNNGTPTHSHSSSTIDNAIDLCLVSSDLATKCSW